MFRKSALLIATAIGLFVAAPAVPTASASSHMDAPLISLDDPANITDVYAFVSRRAGYPNQRLTLAMSVYPFEEPGIGPNNYRFDPAVIYELHVALDGKVATGRPDFTYRFEFTVDYVNDDTILQTYLGKLDPGGRGVFAANQNLRQSYKVSMFDHRKGILRVLGRGIVPPNNQGRVTPFYNVGDDGDKPAKPGVTRENALDPYTAQSIAALAGHRFFAGQRDDAFYGDIQSIFDLDFTFGRDRATPGKPFDSQGGFNVHTIVAEVPMSVLEGAKKAGVWATTKRRIGNTTVQVGRQGNPLFNEAFVALKDKDAYNRTRPSGDAASFAGYAADPELSALFSVDPLVPGLLETIFVPDVIKVDLTTPPARLAGQPGFNRLSVFGGDTLTAADGTTVAGGWPNGRRFGDDVIDIGIVALGIAGPGPDFSAVDIDRVKANDATFHTVFPYAPTPQNGRVHDHH